MELINSPLVEKGKVHLVRRFDLNKIKEKYKSIYKIIAPFDNSLNECKLFCCEISGYRFYYPFTLSGNSYFYEQLEKFNWYYMPWKWEHEQAANYIRNNQYVLEIGCAHGAFIKKIKEEKNASIFGLELNHSAAESLKKNNIPNSQRSIQEFSLINKNQFDIICSFQVLEHVANVKSFLRSSIDCLKSGGKLIISVPNNDSFIKWDKDNPLNLPPHHMGLWNERSLRYISDLFNLKIVEIFKEPLQSYHVDWYVNIIVEHFVPTIFLKKVVDKFKIKRLLSILVNKYKYKITGHSIMFIYEK